MATYVPSAQADTDLAAAQAELATLRAEVARLAAREQRNCELRLRTRALANRIRRQHDPASLLADTAGRIGAEFAAERVLIELGPDVEADDRAAADWAAGGDAAAPADLLDAVAHETALARSRVAAGDTGASVVDAGPYLLLTAAFEGGILVLVRGSRGAPWQSAEVGLVQHLAGELGRALRHAHELHHERQLVERLRELDRAKDEFVSTISHELRTPLTNITGYIDTLLDGDAGPLPPMQRKMLGIVQRNTCRLRTLIEDLLTLSKVESGAFRYVHEPVELRELAREAVADVEAAATKAGIRLVCRLGAPAPVVEGDRGQLYRAIANVLSNAIKFTPAAGTITVRIDATPDSAVLTVTDTGIGIPEKDQRHLFTRFFRASNASVREIQGSGLGLAIVKVITSHHGGELAVESVEDEGTTVRLRLPAAPQACRSADGPPVAPALDALRGPVTGLVELPSELLHRTDRTFNLGHPGYLRWMYETVLAEATSVDQLATWLDGATLVAVWPELYVPERIREEWERRHPALRSATALDRADRG